MVALVDLQLHQDVLCTAKLNWTDLTCGLQPPSLKTRLRNSRQLCGGKLRSPSRQDVDGKLPEDVFFARAPKSAWIYKIPTVNTKLGLPQKLSHARLEI